MATIYIVDLVNSSIRRKENIDVDTTTNTFLAGWASYDGILVAKPGEFFLTQVEAEQTCIDHLKRIDLQKEKEQLQKRMAICDELLACQNYTELLQIRERNPQYVNSLFGIMTRPMV
jgi:hypothetical protein